MKTSNKKVIGLTLLLSITSFAQEYKFGKVSKEELIETACPTDSSANAAVLYESKNIQYEYNQSEGFQLITEVFKRVKLYNKNGFDYGTDEVFLYKNRSDKEKISGLKGVTYSLVDDKIVETKLTKDGIFENEYSEYHDQVKFTLPSLQEGSIVEYKYKVISPFAHNIDKIYLQQKIPIKKIEVRVGVPEYYNFKRYTRGYLPINLKESKRNDKINFTSKTRTGTGGFSIARTSFSNSSVDYTENVYDIVSAGVPAFKEEPYSGNPDNYLSSIVFELQFTKFPNSNIKKFSTTWEAVAKTIYDDPRFGDELKKTSYFEKDVDLLVQDVSDPLKKASLIFDFVKKKMAWNNKYRAVTKEGVKQAYKDGVGNSAEINLMLVAMLDYAGVNTNPVLVSSDKSVLSLFPTLEGFDYVIARVKYGDKIIYLDATDKYGEPNVLPDRVVHGSGRVISESGTSKLINFRPTKASSVKHSVLCELDSNGIIKGKQSISRFFYLAHNFRVHHGVKSMETQVKRLKERYEINDIAEYQLSGVEDLGKPVSERFEFELTNEAEVIENEIFFSPLLFLRDKENIFKSEERKYPIDFGYGYTNKIMVSIKIPEGFQVAEIPEGSAFKLPENIGSFIFRTTVMGDSIQISVTETLNVPFIPTEYYPSLKQFYNQIIQKESDQVVLKKI